MSDGERGRLLQEGFLFLPGTGLDFNEESAFHSNAYLLRTWGRFFGHGLHRAGIRGISGSDDLAEMGLSFDPPLRAMSAIIRPAAAPSRR